MLLDHHHGLPMSDPYYYMSDANAARTRHPPARALVQSATSAVAGVSEMESSDGMASTDERRRRPDGLRDSKSRLCRRTYWRSEPSSLPARPKCVCG